MWFDSRFPNILFKNLYFEIKCKIKSWEISIDNRRLHTNQSGNQTQNAGIFYNVNLKNIFAMLHSRRYPEVDSELIFSQQNSSMFMMMPEVLEQIFFRMCELVSNINITPEDYKALFPLFVSDIAKQSDKLKNSVTDIQIKAQCRENLPANTKAFAVVISDKK